MEILLVRYRFGSPADFQFPNARSWFSIVKRNLRKEHDVIIGQSKFLEICIFAL